MQNVCLFVCLFIMCFLEFFVVLQIEKKRERKWFSLKLINREFRLFDVNLGRICVLWQRGSRYKQPKVIANKTQHLQMDGSCVQVRPRFFVKLALKLINLILMKTSLLLSSTFKLNKNISSFFILDSFKYVCLKEM